MTKQEKTPDAVTHFPELDGIRGLAILLVLVAHGANFLALLPGPNEPGYATWGMVTTRTLLQGWGGVDIFFALSGYLITSILLRARSHAVYFAPFYGRRALRIFPIYYFMLLVTLLVAHFWHGIVDLVPHGAYSILPYFFYLQNWPIFWASWMGLTSLWGIYWSLAVEEQFYMIWPTLIRYISPRIMLAICVVGFLTGIPVRYFLLQRHGLALGILQSPFTRLDGLFVGAAIALYRTVYKRPVRMSWALYAMASGCVIYAGIALRWPGEFVGAGKHIWCLGVTAFALVGGGLIAASHYRRPLLHRMLTLHPLLFAGRVSYGLYVYHIPIYFLVGLKSRALLHRFHLEPSPFVFVTGLVLTIALSTAVAAISFKVIETPFLKLKRHFPSAAVQE